MPWAHRQALLRSAWVVTNSGRLTRSAGPGQRRSRRGMLRRAWPNFKCGKIQLPESRSHGHGYSRKPTHPAIVSRGRESRPVPNRRNSRSATELKGPPPPRTLISSPTRYDPVPSPSSPPEVGPGRYQRRESGDATLLARAAENLPYPTRSSYSPVARVSMGPRKFDSRPGDGGEGDGDVVVRLR